MFFLTEVALFVDNIHPVITAHMTNVFVASLALVDPIEHPRVELELAELALLGLVASVDTLVYYLLEKHQLLSRCQ
jgi:hypothetical protein